MNTEQEIAFSHPGSVPFIALCCFLLFLFQNFLDWLTGFRDIWCELPLPRRRHQAHASETSRKSRLRGLTEPWHAMTLSDCLTCLKTTCNDEQCKISSKVTPLEFHEASHCLTPWSFMKQATVIVQGNSYRTLVTDGYLSC